MKQFKSVLAMLLALVMILSCLPGVFAADKTDEDIAGAEQPAQLRELKGYKSESFLGSNSYKYAADETVRAIVILSGDPEADVAEAGSERAVSQHLKLMKQHESVRKAMSGISFELKYEFTALTNGFSCDVAYGDLDKIAAIDGVEAVYIANHYAEPELEKKETRMASSNYYFTGVDAAYSYYGVDGTGMVIAVLDTGLNVTHEAFQDLDNCCANYGVLTEDDLALAAAPGKYINPKVPFTYDYAEFDDDVTDYNGHGTHVSGIATGCAVDLEEGAYTFLGAASGAQLVNMKIFYDAESGTNSDIYFAALEDAYRLGVDVINMSIGAQNGFTYDEELETFIFGNIYQRLRKAGIVTCVSAGNEYSMAQYSPVGYVGPEYQDYGTVASPSTYEGNTSVASLENYMYPSFVIKTDAGSFGFTDSSDDGLWMATFGDQTVEYVPVLTSDASDLATGEPADYEGIDVSGKIAVVKRGDITFEEKVENAYNAGAIGCIVVNNQSGTISMLIETFEVPAVSVDMSAADILLNASVYELTTPTEMEYVENANVGLMSDFSNWGTSPMLTLDPTITSVGGMVYSSVNTGDDAYEVYSGTSMSSPNYAGTIALVMQGLRDMGVTDKKECADLATALLEASADMLMDEDGYPYSPRKQGAGLANAASALTMYEESGCITEPIQELGDDPERTGHYTFTAEIKNDSTYSLYYIPEAYLLFDYVANAGTEANPYWVNTQTSDFAYLGNEGYASVSYELNGADVTDGFALAVGETAEITVDIQLDDDIKAYFDETFPNGNFVEGFVCFNDVENDNGEVIYFDDDYNAYKLDEIGAYQVDDWDNYVPILDGENKIYYEGDLADLSPYAYYTTHATLLAYYGDWTDGDVLEAADFRDYIDAEYWVNTTVADEEGNTYADYGYTGLDLLDYYTSPNMGYTAIVLDGAPQSLVWYLGDNLYTYVPFYEEHISFSTLDTDADNLYANGFYLEPYQLRNCQNLIMTVSNKETGEVYFVDNTPYLPKAYYDTDNAAWSPTGAFYWDGTDAEGNYVPTGTIVNINFDAILPYGETEKDNVWNFDCLVDYTAPAIESAVYDATAKTLTVTANDENYLANIIVYTAVYDDGVEDYVEEMVFDAEGFSSDVAGESFTATFDVSLLLDNGYEAVYVGALDYATNERDLIVRLCGHENTEIRDAVDATCLDDGYTGDTYCTDCGELIAAGEVIPALGHDIVEDAAVAATCTETGLTAGEHCTRCDYVVAQEVVDALGHDLVDHEAQAVTCTDIGWDAYQTCTRCDYTTYVEIPALDHDLVDHEAKAATCTEVGWDAYQTCTRCDYTTYVEIPALGHDLVDHEAQAPTCTEVGWNAYQTCTRCDYTTYEEIAPLGHTPAEAVKENEKAATCTEAGSYDEVVYCSVCSAELSRETKTVEALGHDYVDGICTVCGAVEPTEPTEPTEEPTEPTEEPTEAPTEPTEKPTEPTEKPTEPTEAPTEPTAEPTECDGGENCPSKNFKDVNKGDWYHAAVDFVVARGMFNGMTETSFEPNTAMSRAMLVTVLWRYEGSVEEGENIFTDVPDGQWYTKAVAWAAKNGIVDGVGDKKFDPQGNITREQMAAILYRYATKKGFDVSKTNDLKDFPDASKVSSWAKDAVSWTVAEAIITGNEGKLDPQGNATRAQVATILMRFLDKFAK